MIDRHADDCGCCTGTAVLTPVRVENRPGLNAIAYRVGTHGTFKRSLLARLSGSDLRPLGGLRTREDDDFSIALLDAWAVVSDVLTFYQERVANESYLRTATERLSVRELARLIGYQLGPGVGAQTHLAFTLETTPGAPTSVTLAPGLKVQSVPGPEEKPQTFETVESIEARPAWNALRPQTMQPQPITAGLTALYLTGTDTQLQPGDMVLFVGSERDVASPGSTAEQRWDIRVLQTADPDPDLKITKITWFDGLSSTGSAASPTQTVYALRQRAAMFGHNAPDPLIVKPAMAAANGNWKNFDPPDKRIDLDAVYPRLLPGSWVVLVRPSDTNPMGITELYKANGVATPSITKFGLSGKITRIFPDILEKLGPGTGHFSRRATTVFAVSDRLDRADRPRDDPVQGNVVDLLDQVADLIVPRMVAVSGRETADGPMVSELAEVLQVQPVSGGTRLHFADPLQHHYLRDTVSINANVALATHGETVREVLGAGDPGQPFQRFPLRQGPLTYTSAATVSGRESTLQLRVNDLLWQEVPTLYGRGPDEPVYVTQAEESGTTTVLFGDGRNGLRLPRGLENVRAMYRKGIGLHGLVKAAQLTTLLTRPLGVKEVTNPTKATGADDPEVLTDARQNAPVAVLTLERVVSLRDYEDFARTFAGIAKTLATWSWAGWARSVFLTVAGPGGALPDAALISNLTTALRTFGDPHVRFRVAAHRSATFQITGHVKIASGLEPEKVLAAVTAALREQFSFTERAFGQPVVLSEVIAAIQHVPGVAAVDLDSLYRTGDPALLNTRLLAAMPDGNLGAELLALDPQPPALDVMA